LLLNSLNKSLKTHVHHPKGVHQALESSLNRLNLEYMDLYLIHWPNLGGRTKRKKVWFELEKLCNLGLSQSIGVSNFLIKHLSEILKACLIKPVINQIEYLIFIFI